MIPDPARVETRAVIAAKFLRGQAVTLATHAVNLETGQTLCLRIQRPNIAAAGAVDTVSKPTCGLCARRDPRPHADPPAVPEPVPKPTARGRKGDLRRGGD